ncbi:MAG: transglycosylase SLT domain-containing protein [Betaproteobacteria bacterium]
MAAVALLGGAVPPTYAAFDGDASRLIEILRTQARALEHGEQGALKDPLLAINFYCEAARLGDAESQFSLGWIYANGRGVPRDDRLASIFFGMAAEQGHEYAQKMVGVVGPAIVDLPDCMREPEVPPERTIVAPRDPRIEVDTFVAVTPEQKRVAAIVRKLAPEYRVNPQFALAIIRAESNFDVNARSPKNAQGLMQLIPDTAARFNVKRPYDPVQNVRGGLAYLRWLLAYFQGNVTLVAAAYNAGEGAVERYGGIPPYAETRAYVQKIRRYFRKNDHPYDAAVTDPSPALQRIRIVRVP